MPQHTKFIFVAALLGSFICLTAAPEATASQGALPVSVSSANYAANSWDDVRRMVADPRQLNPLARETEPLAKAQTYIFAQGELYESDVSYADVCRQLEIALTKKGYVNAADAQGRVARPDKIDLILRISSGGRPWRTPAVRTENLTWRHGLTADHKTTQSLIGGQVSWDNRAGGDDDALSTAVAAQGVAESTTGGLVESSQGATQASGYESTRDFFLLVVDAFGYEDLVQKQSRAQRRWTTFVALPRQDRRNFSEVLVTMLRAATPYFGETTSGMQVFTDARATVKLGELQIIDPEVRPAAPEKK